MSMFSAISTIYIIFNKLLVFTLSNNSTSVSHKYLKLVNSAKI